MRLMIGYASSTNTPRNLYALQVNGWGLLETPDTLDNHRRERPLWIDGSPAPYCLDNGAWGAHNQRKEWDPRRFEAAIAAVGAGAEFVVVPDIVGGGRASLDRSREWLRRLRARHPDMRLLIPVQDGMTPHDVADLVGPLTGIFLGGTTDDDGGGWKIDTMPVWGHYCEMWGVYLHVGRVNTMNRIEKCAFAGAQSFDGTSLTKFSKNAERLQWARHENPSREHPWQRSFYCPAASTR